MCGNVSRHPDKNPHNIHNAKLRFQKITAAYERLSDEADVSDSEDDDIMFDYEDEENFDRAADLFLFM